jgi:hypothetical protein
VGFAGPPAIHRPDGRNMRLGEPARPQAKKFVFFRLPCRNGACRSVLGANAKLEEPDMCHSLIGADRRTHGKIVAVALAGAISLVMVTAMAWRADTKGPTAHAQTNALVLKAGKPATSAAVSSSIIH